MPLVNVIHGEQLPGAAVNVRTPVFRIPLWAALTWFATKAFARLAWWLLRHPRTAAVTVAGLWLYLHLGWLGLGLVVAGLVLVAAGWRWRFRTSFYRIVWWPLIASWRRLRYRRLWHAAMKTTGLAVRWDRQTVVPQLVRVRRTVVGDVLTVRMVTGQVPDDYGKASLRLAHSFTAQACRVTTHPRRPELVQIALRHSDLLAATIAPITPTTFDPAGLPVGRVEDGSPLALRLSGSHVLVVGATGAGKGSVIWSTIAAAAPGIKAGVVKVWTFDPKGGMELAFGRPLFDRFYAADFEQMADALDAAVTVLRDRTARLAGITRQHTPSIAEPLYLLVVDELAALTAYLQNRQLKDRIRNSLNMILSQGRAVGVHLIAAAQDPRKETLTVRDLFPTRIGLRMSEAAHVDLALGENARDRGALCDLIAMSAPGVAYMVLDDDPVPQRVRFCYWTDADIRQLARDFGTLRAVPNLGQVA